MNFATNQVLQFYDLTAPASGTSVITPVQLPDNGVQFIIERKNSAGKVISKETTDVITNLVGRMVVDGDIVNASADKKALKQVTLAVGSGLVIAGQEYIIALTFRGFGLEDTYHKFIAAKAASTTAADLYVLLANSALLQRSVENEPLYDVLIDVSGTEYVAVKAGTYPAFSTSVNYAAGDKVVYTDGLVYAFTSSHSAGSWTTDVSATGEAEINSTTVASGFIIKEAKPYWQLGSFPERTATIEIGTSPIIASGVERNDWLVDGSGNPAKFVPESTPSIVNSHKIADLEYFCKGEKGNPNALANWPDNIKPELLVNPDSSTGYSTLAVHYAYVGDNQSNQKSERDAIFAVDGTTTTKLAAIVDALDGTTFSGKPVKVIA